MDPHLDMSPPEPVLEIRTFWGASLLDVTSFTPGRKAVWLGAGGKEADLIVPGAELGADRIPLVSSLGGRLRMTVPPGAACRLALADGTQGELAELTDRVLTGLDPERPGCRCLELPEGASARLGLGRIELRLAVRDRPKGLVSKLLDRVDPIYPNALLITAVFFAALIATIHLRPAQVAASEERLGRVPDRYVQFLLERTAPDPAPLALVGDLRTELDQRDGAEASERLRGKEGDAGAPDAPETGHRLAVRAQVQSDEHKIRGLGLVAALTDGPAGLPGAGGPSLGSDLESVLGELQGAVPGRSHGSLGWGLTGPGFGGGAHSDTLGTADLRTHGSYSGQPEYGNVRRRPKPPKEREVIIRTGELTMVGPLSMEAVRAVIERHRDQIRYCYSRELTRDPSLGGKVELRFTINYQGYVVMTYEGVNTTGSQTLVRCMRDRVRTWRFPRLRGGGTVIVNYPWLFHPPKG